MGYAGGKKDRPTYYRLGDHIETLEIDFDPARITYSDLLKVFWESHNPTTQPWKRQYISAVFTHSAAQLAALKESAKQESARRGQLIKTEFLPYEKFWLAEDYHQKYALRQYDRLMAEFRAMYPVLEGFISSTAVARANGYASGYGTLAQLEKEIDSYGLSPQGRDQITRIVERYNRY